MSHRKERHNTPFCILSAFTTVLLLMACSSTKNRLFPESSLPAVLQNPPEADAYPDAGALFLLDEGRMEIYGGPKTGFGMLERHTLIRLCSSRGQKYANIVIPYTSQSKVMNIQARAISPLGKTTFLQDKDIYDVTLYPNFIFYSDQRAKLFTVPGIEDGSMIEYRYDIEIYGRTLWHSWTFQADEPVLVSRFSLTVPSGWPVNYKSYGLDTPPSIDRNPRGFKDTYFWEVKNSPPLKTETGMPPRKEIVKKLAIAPIGFDSWKNVGRWYSDLAEPQMKAGAGVKKLAAQLTGHLQNPHQKKKRLYDWVRDQIRYIAIETGIGGYKPHTAEEVLKARYGDCKDMAGLLCSLFREAGFDASPVLVSTWQNGLPDTTLPSPLPFNHVIVFAPESGDSSLWLDVTAKGCSFGQLPWYDQGLPVLIAQAGNTQIRKTPRTTPENNRIRTSWEVQLNDTGGGSITGKTCFWGAQAALLRDEFLMMSPDDQREWMTSYLARRCSGSDLDSLQVTGTDSCTDPLSLFYVFHTTDFTGIRNGQLVYRPWTAAKFELSDVFRSQERLYPVRFRYAAREIFQCTVALPQGFSASNAFYSDSLTSKYGHAVWSWSDQNGSFVSERICDLPGEEVPPQEYKEFRMFFDTIRAHDLMEALFIKRE